MAAHLDSLRQEYTFIGSIKFGTCPSVALSFLLLRTEDVALHWRGFVVVVVVDAVVACLFVCFLSI